MITWAALTELVRRQVNGGDPEPGSHPMEMEVVAMGGSMIPAIIRLEYMENVRMGTADAIPDSGRMVFRDVGILTDNGRKYVPLPSVPAHDHITVMPAGEREASFIQSSLDSLRANVNARIVAMAMAEDRFFVYYENSEGSPRMYFQDLPAFIYCVDIHMQPGAYRPKHLGEYVPAPASVVAKLIPELVRYFTNTPTGEDTTADNRETATRA